MVPLKYLNNFWRTLEILLINCEINLILIWSENCVISNARANEATTFPATSVKLYVPVVTLWTDNNANILQQLKSGFKRTINWIKKEPKIKIQKPSNEYFDFLIKPSFQGV